jgi:hypothetical protein
MRVVTTCHKAGYDEYGFRFRESLNNWPAGTEFYWYVEGYEVPQDERLTQRSITKLAPLNDLKARYANYRPPNYLFDVVRFANKVFATADALRDYDGLGVWCDADAVAYAPIPDGLLQSMLGDAYIGLFKRAGMYSETGMVLFNCAHYEHSNFLDTWLAWYTSDSFKSLNNWTDCETLDATVRKMEASGKIRSVSLSAGHEKDMHPMAKVELAKYLDHCKGGRKAAGFSPENANRSAA